MENPIFLAEGEGSNNEEGSARRNRKEVEVRKSKREEVGGIGEGKRGPTLKWEAGVKIGVEQAGGKTREAGLRGEEEEEEVKTKE